MMYYGITLTLVKFPRFLDEIGATQLASVSGRFASFKYECESRSSRQTTSVFHINPVSYTHLTLPTKRIV